MFGDETAQQGGIEAIDVTNQLIEVVAGAVEPEIEADMAEFGVIVDEQDALVLLADQVVGESDGDRGGSHAALGAEEGNDVAGVAGAAGVGGPLPLLAIEGVGELAGIEWILENLIAAGAHGGEQEIGIVAAGKAAAKNRPKKSCWR